MLLRVALEPMMTLFDRRSGATHVVADVVPVILDALQQGPTDLAGLAARIDVTDGDLRDLADRVEELLAVGLVEVL